jgi:dTMP kinase
MRALFPKGLLIAIEGIDGGGKTTAAGALAQYCGERGILATLSKEPTGMKWGQELRRSAATGRLSLDDEIDLFHRDRDMHVHGTIRPAMAAGHVVIIDRYYWSTAAYQGARGADPHALVTRNEEFAPRPDLVILLDLPATVGLERIRLRGDEPNAFENAAALEKSRAIFLDLAARHSAIFDVIDATQGNRAVARACLQAMRKAAAPQLAASALAHYDLGQA